MAESNPKHYVNIPRKVVLHRMETAESLDDRLYWGMILWSWCGPQPSAKGLVVKKDPKGWIREADPLPATLNDLRVLLGLAPGMMGHISRAAQRLVEVGAIRFGENIGRGRSKKIYIERSPALPDPSILASTGNNAPQRWNIANLPVLATMLPTEPEAHNEAVQWLNGLSTRFNGGLKALRTEYREELVHGLQVRGVGILIEQEKISRLVEESVSPSYEEDRPTDPPPPPEPEIPPEPEPTPEPPAPSLETSKPAEEMETLLLQEAGPQFPGEVPGRSLCLQIIQTLADTPWDEFRQKLRFRKWKRDDSMGLTRALAQEVRDRWIRDANKQTSPARGQPACTICTQPLNGGVVIQGAHFACHNNAKGASG